MDVFESEEGCDELVNISYRTLFMSYFVFNTSHAVLHTYYFLRRISSFMIDTIAGYDQPARMRTRMEVRQTLRLRLTL